MFSSKFCRRDSQLGKETSCTEELIEERRTYDFETLISSTLRSKGCFGGVAVDGVEEALLLSEKVGSSYLGELTMMMIGLHEPHVS